MVFVSKVKKNGKKKKLLSTGQEKWGWKHNTLIQKKTQHTSPNTMQSCLFPRPSQRYNCGNSYVFPSTPPCKDTTGKGEKRRDSLNERSLTLQFLSSGVVSSNSSPSLKLISVFLKVLWVLITTLSPSLLMITVGLVTFPTCRIANPTPTPPGKSRNHHPLFFFFIYTLSFTHTGADNSSPALQLRDAAVRCCFPSRFHPRTPVPPRGCGAGSPLAEPEQRRGAGAARVMPRHNAYLYLSAA